MDTRKSKEDWDYTFVFFRTPYPYTRTTRNQKWVDERFWKYANSQNELRLDIRRQMAMNGWEKIPDTTNFHVQITIFTGKEHYHSNDGDNQVKAILDAFQGELYKVDCWADSIDFVRCSSPETLVMTVVKFRLVTETWLIARALNLSLERLKEVGIIKAFLEKLNELEDEDESP